MDSQKLIETLHLISQRIEKEKDFLTSLDNDIADGDHGINLNRGFQEVDKAIANSSDKLPGDILKMVGMTLLSKVGGASGPLFGTAFLKSAMYLKDKKEIDIDDFLACLNEAIEGIKTRGKAIYGEKTMLDSMIPSLEEMKKTLTLGKSEKEVLEAGVKKAYEGIEFTKTIVATKGRASYCGERSIGHQDPGATSYTYILEEIAKVI